MSENGPTGRYVSPRAKLITGLAVGAALLTGAGFGVDYLVRNTNVFDGPKSDMIHTLNESDLSMDDRMYLFEYNAPLVDAGKGVSICDASVIDRASPDQQLEYLLSEIQETDTKSYGKVLGTMLEKIGTDLYADLNNLFKGGK